MQAYLIWLIIAFALVIFEICSATFGAICFADTRKADILQREDAFEIVGDELRRGVERERREVATAKARDAEILDD